MTEFLLDCEEDLSPLGAALAGFAECDLPLLTEVRFVDGDEIRRLNREQRGVDRVTDVLSFPAMELTPGAPVSSDEHGECIDEAEGRSVLLLGSVAVCTERAKEQAAEYGHSVAREVCYLIVHGILHCLGYDHEREEEKRAMREKEEEAMGRLRLGREQ